MKSVCVDVFVHICVSGTVCMCVCAQSGIPYNTPIFVPFFGAKYGFCFGAQLEINQANLRQIHDSHYGNESRQHRILTFASKRDASILSLSDERFS